MRKTELELQQMALRIRIGIVEAISAKGGGHIGGTLDLAELLSVLYSEYMRVRPDQPAWDGRDYLICSKGHAGPALYATLALLGFFPYERLYTLNQEESLLPGHCDRLKVPGIDATTGSLGQGLSIACGVALGKKIAGSDQRVFCILGDGELAEGQNWEAAQFAAHFCLDHLIAFLDWNNKQIDGTNDEVMSLGDPAAKFRSFGWNACVLDGTDIKAISSKIKETLASNDGKPSIIILRTLKGAGVSCVSNIENNHCIGFTKSMADQAFAELRDKAKELGMEVNI